MRLTSFQSGGLITIYHSSESIGLETCKTTVHIFWEGRKTLRNLHFTFVLSMLRQSKVVGEFAKLCGLLRIYELYYTAVYCTVCKTHLYVRRCHKYVCLKTLLSWWCGGAPVWITNLHKNLGNPNGFAAHKVNSISNNLHYSLLHCVTKSSYLCIHLGDSGDF